MKVFVAGATGYIGQHVSAELTRRGHDAVCLVRPQAGVHGKLESSVIRERLDGCDVRFGEVTDTEALANVVDGTRFDAAVSCLASRSGAPDDAWRIDHQANSQLLRVLVQAGISHFVLLSAICVQRPRLAFQHAKLTFEQELRQAPVRHSIVRPTAFFKSLSGQIERVKAGKPYVVFGDGNLTACTPIAERELARFLVDCLDDPARFDTTLPIGGPGPPQTPLQQGELLFRLLGREPRFRHVPIGLMRGVAATLSATSRVVPPLRDKAEFARTGLYYATESMLVFDERAGRYDASATPSFGTVTLEDHFRDVLEHGLGDHHLGDHAVF
ncbi:MAG: NAD(P)H-binding protein [Myxococcota bacterium]